MTKPTRYYATPTLIRAARGPYARAIRARLNAKGIDDLPRNGAFILAGIDGDEGPRQDLTAALGVTKQAISQIVDVLVTRGYVERTADPADRRRIGLALTASGRQVSDAVVEGVEDVDRQLHELVTAEQVASMRAALMALAKIKVDSVATGSGRLRPPRQFRTFSPIFPVRDMIAALSHYADLGFQTIGCEGGGDYGFANRDRIGLQFALDPNHDPETGGAATYLYVADADALYEEWSRPGLRGHTHPVEVTPYGLREGSHRDPEGNLIRFGSEIPE